MSAAQEQPYVRVRRRSVEYPIVIDPTLPIRGECASPSRGQSTVPFIKLRKWDEQVLLHEAMHALIAEGGFAPDLDGPIEEDLVGHLSHGIYEMGWRLERVGDDPRVRRGEYGEAT